MTREEKKALERLRSQWRRLSLNPETYIPATLYHYTSAAGLLGIVSSGILRASNFAYLNDAAEIQYGRRLVEDAIEASLTTYESVARRKGLRQVKDRLADIGKGLEFYLACFCTKPDLLSQWRGYGGSSRGRFCIGFGYDEDTEGWKGVLARVIYDEKEQQEEIGRVMGLATQALSVGDSTDFVEQVHEHLARELVETICYFKHPGFSEEREWRIMHQANDHDQIVFEATGGLLRPFVELWSAIPVAGPRRLPIVEVIVGPSAIAAQSVRSVERLLDQLGYQGVTVTATELPYREL
jgi:hypothetical protein